MTHGRFAGICSRTAGIRENLSGGTPNTWMVVAPSYIGLLEPHGSWQVGQDHLRAILPGLATGRELNYAFNVPEHPDVG